MKRKFFLICSSMSVAGMVALAQSGSGGTTGATGSAGGSSTSGTTGGTSPAAQSGTQNQNRQNLPPGLQNRDQLPPGLERREQLPPGLQRRVEGTAQASGAATNGFSGSTQAGAFGGDTNRVPMTPTSDRGTTNRIYGTTNTATGTLNQRSTSTSTRVTQDKAYTAEDQRLLVEVRRQVLPILNVTEATTPVHFVMQNGVVTLVGTVPTAQQRQRIVTMIERTPGVTQVVDQLQVTTDTSTMIGSTGVSGSTIGTNALAGSASAITDTNLTATSRSGGTNRIYSGTNQLSNPRLTPQSDQILQNRPNQGSVPPGLQNRDQFPSGAQSREPLTSPGQGAAPGNRGGTGTGSAGDSPNSSSR